MKDSSKVVKDTKIESYNQKELLEKIRKIVNINLQEFSYLFYYGLVFLEY